MNKIQAQLSKGSIWLLLLLLAIPAAFTYFAWQITDEASSKSTHEKFTALAFDSERALRHRIESYKQALRGGVGFLEGSDDVTSAEWMSYVSALEISRNSPGINGIGRIDEVNLADLDAFVDHMSADKGYTFSVHPQVNSGEYFVIRNIAPYETNTQAVGLNIAFEPNRRQAATHARDTGKATITKRILLVQDAEKTPGFLLLLPSYKKGMPLLTVEQRRAAFRSWVYAPFIGKNFFKDLTDSQGQMLHLRVYDGDEQNADTLIFDSNAEQAVDTATEHESVKVLEIMEKKWLLSWTSTPAFEALESSNEPLLVLIIGAIFTGACGVFLILMGIRGSEESGTRPGYVLPAVAFVMTVGAGVYLAEEFNLNERNVLVTNTIKEVRSFRRAILTNVEDRVQDLGRMARRWVDQGGLSKETWHADARQYVSDQADLKAVEWVDSSFHVRWVEPLVGNERAIGLNIVKDDATRVALSLAEANSTVMLSSPFDLVQGYKAVLSYSPLGSGNSFDGFIVGVFGVEELISAALDLSRSENFVVRLSSKGEEFYRSANDPLPSDRSLVHQETIQLLDKTWTISVFPSTAMMASTNSF
ncbi:MAG: CHASE domain-containing protein, partial [Hyphomicrobiales bacterium]